MDDPTLFSDRHNYRAKSHLPKGSKGLFELRLVEFVVTIEVHALEDDFESADSDATLLLDSKLELKIKFADHNILVDSVEGHRTFVSSLKINYLISLLILNKIKQKITGIFKIN